MPRWHDDDAAVCACFACSEQRYHAALSAEEARELAEGREADATREFVARQLRLPMSPLPHVAHFPDHFARAVAAPCQPELL